MKQSNGPDPFALATLAGVVVMLAISSWNMWNLNRLAERVVKLETATAPPPAVAERGPDPDRAYAIDITGAPTKGPDTAPVTIVEFADFQCPFCARARSTLRRIEQVYKGQVRFVWKHLPLSIHENAIKAALAAEAARKQGRFWEYHDALLANHNALDIEQLKSYAKELRLDVTRLERDMRTPEPQQRIDADIEEARTLSISMTPSFFINGRFLRGAQPFEAFANIIDEELRKRDLSPPSRSSSD